MSARQWTARTQRRALTRPIARTAPIEKIQRCTHSQCPTNPSPPALLHPQHLFFHHESHVKYKLLTVTVAEVVNVVVFRFFLCTDWARRVCRSESAAVTCCSRMAGSFQISRSFSLARRASLLPHPNTYRKHNKYLLSILRFTSRMGKE